MDSGCQETVGTPSGSRGQEQSANVNCGSGNAQLTDVALTKQTEREGKGGFIISLSTLLTILFTVTKFFFPFALLL